MYGRNEAMRGLKKGRDLSVLSVFQKVAYSLTANWCDYGYGYDRPEVAKQLDHTYYLPRMQSLK